MGNSAMDAARTAARTERKRRHDREDNIFDRFTTGYDESYSSGKNERSSIYNDINTGLAGIGGGGGGGAGIRDAVSRIGSLYTGVNRPKSIDESIALLMGIGRSGGIDPSSYDRIRGGGGYEKFAETGGLTEENIKNIRGDYGDIAKSVTGGYAPDALANIRARSASPISAIYDADQNSINRIKAVQGGYAPGHSGSLARLSRSRGEAAGNVARNTELGINELVHNSQMQARDRQSDAERALVGITNQGKQFGISGMSTTEMALQNAIVGHKLSGSSAGGNLGLNKWRTSIADAARKDAADRAAAALRLQGATSAAGASRASRAQQEASRRAYINQKLGLYGMQHGPTQSYIDANLQHQAIAGGHGIADVNSQYQSSQDDGGFNWKSLLSILGGAAPGATDYVQKYWTDRKKKDEEEGNFDSGAVDL